MSEWNDQRKLQATYGTPMPDRTQTLSVEMPRELAERARAAKTGAEQRRAEGEILSAIGRALSQPEHQGEEGKADWQALAQVEREGREAQEELARERRDALVEMNDRIIELERRCVELRRQPPAPVLSDEERGRLEEIAEEQKAYLVTRLRQAEDRASKAEAEREGWKAHAVEAERGTIEAEKLLRKAETALGDLAEEFERRATAFDENGTERDPKTRVALRLAASLAREKAAELKEGER